MSCALRLFTALQLSLSLSLSHSLASPFNSCPTLTYLPSFCSFSSLTSIFSSLILIPPPSRTLLILNDLKLFYTYLFIFDSPLSYHLFLFLHIGFFSYSLYSQLAPVTQHLTPLALVICGSSLHHPGVCLCRQSDTLQEGGISWNCLSQVECVSQHKGINKAQLPCSYVQLKYTAHCKRNNIYFFKNRQWQWKLSLCNIFQLQMSTGAIKSEQAMTSFTTLISFLTRI